MENTTKVWATPEGEYGYGDILVVSGKDIPFKKWDNMVDIAEPQRLEYLRAIADRDDATVQRIEEENML